MQRRIYIQIFLVGSLMLLSSCEGIFERERAASDSTSTDSISTSLLADSLNAVPDSISAQLVAEDTTDLAETGETPSAQEAPQQLTAPLSDSLFQAYVLEKLNELSASQDSMPSARDTSQVPFNADRLATNLRFYWGRVFLSILVLVIFFVIIRSLVWTLETLAERNATRRLLFKRIVPISRILLWSFAIYIILLYIFEISGAALVSAGAAIGVALGFAGQDVLKNIFGGLIIIADQPFQIGDKISIGGTYGEVISIGLRSTRIVTADDNLVSVPNAHFVENQVSNANSGELHCQAVVDLYLPGWIDVAQAKSIAYSAAATSKYVFLNKPIVVHVIDDFKEMSLVRIRVKAYVFDCLKENAFKSEITETAKSEYLQHGMLSPFAYNFDRRVRGKYNDSFGAEEEES